MGNSIIIFHQIVRRYPLHFFISCSLTPAYVGKIIGTNTFTKCTRYKFLLYGENCFFIVCFYNRMMNIPMVEINLNFYHKMNSGIIKIIRKTISITIIFFISNIKTQFYNIHKIFSLFCLPETVYSTVLS